MASKEVARRLPGLTLTRLFLLGIALCLSATADAAPEKVHLIFSNHLVSRLTGIFVHGPPLPPGTVLAWAQKGFLLQDLGFDGINPVPGTDDNVINKYFSEFFPQAVR